MLAIKADAHCKVVGTLSSKGINEAKGKKGERGGKKTSHSRIDGKYFVACDGRYHDTGYSFVEVLASKLHESSQRGRIEEKQGIKRSRETSTLIRLLSCLFG